jgi:DNA-binding NtrC family response regulator
MSAASEPRILVVDDDVDICRNLTDILADMGYRVDSAHDGPSALRLLERARYDVALLDYKMPGMNGVELYREIKRRSAGTVALLVTAFATPATTAEALEAGAWKVLDKPVDLGGLMSLVDEALSQPLILIVDDDRDLCASLWDVLRERGYRVGMAHGVEEAARQIDGAGYRVVLIDLRMPDGGGDELFRRVRAAAPDARTVLITGHRAELGGLIDSVLSEGADAVCYKPFDVPRLLQTIQSLTDRG